MKYCSVVPALRLPRRFKAFDYAVPPKIAVTRGDLVRITFAGRRTLGLVVAANTSPTFDPKKIKTIDGRVSGVRFRGGAIATLESVQKFTNAALPLVVRTFIPEAPKRI